MRPWATIGLVALIGLGFPASADRLTEAPLVNPAWLNQHLDAKDLVILDIRDPDLPETDYKTGHIAGAVSAPYASFGWQETVDNVPDMLPAPATIAARLGKVGIGDASHVIIVPDGMNSFEFAKATRVYWTLKVLGHDDVTILDGGQVAWVNQGLPLSQAVATPAPATFTPHFQPDLVATTEQVQAAMKAGAVLIDARPVAEYQGKRRVAAVRIAGTIPGAVNLPNSALYDGAFVQKSLLDEFLTKTGVKPSQPVITFCNTGFWSSMAWFGLSQVAGHQPVALYDGSMAAWAADPTRPIQ